MDAHFLFAESFRQLPFGTLSDARPEGCCLTPILLEGHIFFRISSKRFVHPTHPISASHDTLHVFPFTFLSHSLAREQHIVSIYLDFLLIKQHVLEFNR